MNIDYSYLKLPSNLKIHLQNDYIMKVQNGIHKRKIFYHVQYDPFEKSQIQQLRNMLKKQGKNYKKDDAQLLRFCYAGDFNLSKSIQKINICQQWKLNFNIQNLSENAKLILQTGVFYTYGRDQDHRPIIIMNLAKVDMTKYKLEDYYCAMNNLFKPIRQYMFIPGFIQSWNIIIDTEERTNLPLSDISRIIDKLSTIYSSTLQRLFILNLNTFLRVVWLGIKRFIHQQTLKKIKVLGPKQMNKILQYFPPHQIQKKYGGKLENLTQYWPIKTPQKKNHHQTNHKNHFSIGQQQSSYYESIDNNQYFFEPQKGNQQCKCCSDDNNCNIF